VIRIRRTSCLRCVIWRHQDESHCSSYRPCQQCLHQPAQRLPGWRMRWIGRSWVSEWLALARVAAPTSAAQFDFSYLSLAPIVITHDLLLTKQTRVEVPAQTRETTWPWGKVAFSLLPLAGSYSRRATGELLTDVASVEIALARDDRILAHDKTISFCALAMPTIHQLTQQSHHSQQLSHS